MKLGKYLHDLLLENETVIVPGFGAFISSYQPAVVDEETHEIKPPSKKISFNSKIRNNDGLLVGHIAEAENISHFDALKRIEREREKLLYQLDKGEKVVFENTGELFFNERQEIQFNSFQNENFLLESFGLESASIQSQPVVKSHDESLTEPSPEQPKVPPVAKESSSENRDVETGFVSETAVDVHLDKIKTEEQEEPVLTEDEGNNGRKRRGWLWLLMLIPILAAGYFVAIRKTSLSLKKNSRSNENGITVIAKPEARIDSFADSLASDSSKIDRDTISLSKAVSDTISTSPAKILYYLVGGSFKARENAEKYLNQLKNKGYQPFHLGKRGSFYIVGIGKYSTGEEAISAKKNFLAKNPDSGAWIMKNNE
ncbi:MAG: SPOR domain-containing protein [Prolixibacteraceae bacterium]|nr:SPOR domain-containing protein [Prolixibacteraceae bacterium]